MSCFHRRNGRRLGNTDRVLFMMFTLLASGPAAGTGETPGDAVPTAEDGDLQPWRIEPVAPPEADPEPPVEEDPTVEEILHYRERIGVGPAHEDYPVIPGCEPVRGETGRLPMVPDRSHHYTSRGICLPAQWIDSFFAEEGADFHAAQTRLRVIPTSRWQSGAERTDSVRINASVALPHTADRLSLILRSDDRNDDRLSERTEVDEIDEPEAEGVFRGALRWAAYRTRQLTTQIDTGFRGRHAFVRSRFRWRTALPADVWFRFNQDFYWRGNEDRRGTATELQFERPVTANSTVRMTSSAESNTRLRREEFRWAWSQGVSWFWRIRKRAALQAGFRVRGRSEPNWRTDTYQLTLRYRQSVWRPWFYYEVEPFTVWRRADDFHRTPGVVARVEMKLGAYP